MAEEKSQSILELFANAQRKYDEENKVGSSAKYIKKLTNKFANNQGCIEQCYASLIGKIESISKTKACQKIDQKSLVNLSTELT